MMLIKDIEQAIRTARENNGITFNLNCNSPKTGYMVSTIGNECKVKDLRPDRIYCFIEWHRELLEKAGYYVGIWLDNGFWYLDISENITDREEAINKGYENNQIAIWDIENGEEIRM